MATLHAVARTHGAASAAATPIRISATTCAPPATILYPTLTAGVSEADIAIRDPVRGRERAAVVLRPVDMNELGRLMALPATAASAAVQRQFALRMCFGGAE